ncbi:16S rRNA (guanine(966)-N(2))-methyltransferase RsmD [Ligilactobacillus saerimneri]|uniref:16S rRNA (guanine(966)-N(2))-methyltransferase RsmD n=1 Tax=Ligilactobacillus saerimneri TaxID=228229 RepID=UPI001C122F10|nr:16S rRNA (guanine(966)-N(2))-methyltransferase RsmD [Ligilactobacillus saerimneri]MBU5309312.1 16S rRNA (guanine(966)-N(2))-methyltransferase RsmD [Ligilactobacillus saerimneri]
MRIISGEYRGRRLKAVPGMKTRPTTDKVKEAMFNIIGPYFAGGVALDLFAGSGGLSIEGVSRGMTAAYQVDRQYQAIKVIKDNNAVTKNPDKFKVLKMDAWRALEYFLKKGITFDYVFLDPPYKKQQIIAMLDEMVTKKLLNPGAVIVCETDLEADLPQALPQFAGLRQAKYGITLVTVYQYKGAE